MAESVSAVKDSLITQLQARGADVPLYRDQIDSYLFFMQQERKMQAKVRKHGLTYTAISAAGKEYEKDNPAVKDALLYNKQRLAILNALGLDTKSIAGGQPPGDDESDL